MELIDTYRHKGLRKKLVDDLRLRPGGEDRDGHPRDPCLHATARGLGVVHPVQGKDEKCGGDDVSALHEAVDHA